MKSKSLCTDPSIYEDVESKQIRRVYKQLAHNADSDRVDKYAIAQLEKRSEFAYDLDTALLVSFRTTQKTIHPKFTKAEKRVLKLLFSIGQAKLSERMYKLLLVDSKMANNIKILAQLQDLINENSDSANNIAATLNIALTDKKTKMPPKEESEKIVKKTPSLKLIND